MAEVKKSYENEKEKNVVSVIPDALYGQSTVVSWNSLSWSLWGSGVGLLVIGAAIHVLYFLGLFMNILRPFTSYLKFACAVDFITGVSCAVSGLSNLFFSYNCSYDSARRGLYVSGISFVLVVLFNLALFIYLLLSPFRGLVLATIILAAVGVSVGFAFAARYHRIVSHPHDYLLTRGLPGQLRQVFLNDSWSLLSEDMKDYMKRRDKEMGGGLYQEMYNEEANK